MELDEHMEKTGQLLAAMRTLVVVLGGREGLSAGIVIMASMELVADVLHSEAMNQDDKAECISLLRDMIDDLESKVMEKH